jgi:hypothetical protein
MKNRNIVSTAILSLLGCGALSCTAQAAPPPVPTSNVNVVNTPTNPVPVIGTVKDAENPARNSVQLELIMQPPAGMLGADAQVTIPAGKIFVLEYVSYQVQTPPGVTATELSIAATGRQLNGTTAVFVYTLAVPPPSFTDAQSGTITRSNQVVRLYAQPGTLFVHFVVNGTGSPPPNVTLDLSGYLVSTQ